MRKCPELVSLETTLTEELLVFRPRAYGHMLGELFEDPPSLQDFQKVGSVRGVEVQDSLRLQAFPDRGIDLEELGVVDVFAEIEGEDPIEGSRVSPAEGHEILANESRVVKTVFPCSLLGYLDELRAEIDANISSYAVVNVVQELPRPTGKVRHRVGGTEVEVRNEPGQTGVFESH